MTTSGYRQPSSEWVYVVRFGLDAAADLDEFRTWYDDVHMPRILEVPGVTSVSRYESPDVASTRHFVTIYAIDGPEVLSSPTYLALPGWEHWRAHLRDWFRSAYRLTDELGDRGREE